jgi:hypothetical protein
MAVRLVPSAKLAETCSPFAKVSACRQMDLADWVEDTRCVFFHRVTAVHPNVGEYKASYGGK